MTMADKARFHDLDHIRLLHHAHADHIESLYGAMKKCAGNPEGVVIEKVGPVRTFLVPGKRWENRAIFHGDETHEQIDDVLRHFDAHGAHCVIEVNIANSYVDPPRNWEARLLPHLLKRGCEAGGMRCVWHLDRWPAKEQTTQSLKIERFSSERLNEFAELKMRMMPEEKWTAEQYQIEGREELHHYVGFAGDQPCAFGSLFVKAERGYLVYWQTMQQFRGKGFQQAGINRCVSDAFDLGCERVFTVSDYNFASPRNLERCGFALAYNYLVVTRQPMQSA